ncbi:hypothetical protein B0T22DRAFT_449799 [Podospora appendiculata]|uniref:Uncharacterized protein n=1 Tax=Podospora appendiculata TaxID=314037 RepID=A0AAE1CG74_9PEZI|nr:hypothetical protein B0T22DRAFT_449799 [Podospora appendiculata]
MRAVICDLPSPMDINNFTTTAFRAPAQDFPPPKPQPFHQRRNTNASKPSRPESLPHRFIPAQRSSQPILLTRPQSHLYISPRSPGSCHNLESSFTVQPSRSPASPTSTQQPRQEAALPQLHRTRAIHYTRGRAQRIRPRLRSIDSTVTHEQNDASRLPSATAGGVDDQVKMVIPQPAAQTYTILDTPIVQEYEARQSAALRDLMRLVDACAEQDAGGTERGLWLLRAAESSVVEKERFGDGDTDSLPRQERDVGGAWWRVFEQDRESD